MRSMLTLLLMIVLAVSAGPAAAITFDVPLEPGQEVPAPTLGGFSPTGSATVDVNTITGDVNISGSYSGMTSDVNNSHLHGLAPAGVPVGVLFGLSNTGGTSGTFSGSATLSAGNLTGLLDGNTYINVHTVNNGPGEIRGQVVDPDIRIFQIPLSASQETPAPVVTGFSPTGSATVVVDSSSGEVEITGSYSGMTSDVNNSHLHGLAPFGTPVGVIFGLSNTGGTSGTFSGSGTLSATNLAGLLDGLTYINIHTVNNGPGEIRGQVIPEPTCLVLVLTGGLTCLRRRR